MSLQSLTNLYNKTWKPLTFLTIAVLIITGSILVYNTIQTGSPIQRDIELVGGKQISMFLDSSPDLGMLSKEIPEASFKLISGAQTTLLVETGSEVNETEIIEKLQTLGVSGEYNIRVIGPALGEVFWSQAQLAIILAFLVMSIVVFILFRTFVPSMAVILAAVTDIIVSMFGMNVLGIELSLATLAALLMLIGYSVDTDIVLTTEMLKRTEAPVSQRVKAAFKTGITMTLCAIAALVALYFVSGSFVLQQMSLVLIIGLLIDIPCTWITNTGMLKWYLERQEKRVSKMS